MPGLLGLSGVEGWSKNSLSRGIPSPSLSAHDDQHSAVRPKKARWQHREEKRTRARRFIMMRVLAAFTSRAPGMTLFNTLRSCIYGAVLLFTIICLAMAGHFQQILASSDLTRFVPFAIFVCTASLIIVLCLLGFSFMFKERNPISTRIELACLGLAGTLWLVLGVYLTTSESQDADVECFASESDVVPMDESIAAFQTDQYQAMYRVLMTFALLNAILLLFSFFTLLALAVMRHRSGDEHMWLQWAQPRTEVPLVFILGALWLAMGAWSTDVIGNTQCDTLGGARTPTKNGDISAQAYCREVKVVQAFSWMVFVLFVFWFIIMIQLINQAQRFGRWRIWDEPIRELGWFGEMPGYYNQHNGAAAYPQAGYIPYGYGYGYPMVQQPQGGQSIIIQPGSNGQPATVTTVPMSSV
ncbi:hypothetical protein CCMSSC00406_0001785 [Pleurotus cornucopiae]|uniref:Uncharacterized protein n=1 Tax=Pleurotus cornucopiae TaxID=5321 RepID=A0ACB7INV8_PLECO|nr:hypothetical protein CCMSSC00406_0001785 [Pleurotus cornucopiae]